MNDRNTVRQMIITALVGGLLSGSLLSAIFSYVVYKERIELEQQTEWKEKVLSGLLGPVCMHLDRTEKAFHRWETKNLYLEVKIIKESNTVIRDLLLTKGHLIPIELLDDSSSLIEHYDVWLENFEKQRGNAELDIDTEFVYAGPEGYGFPKGAEKNFKDQCIKYKNELFGDA
jgi:hypothetical protein